MKKAPVQQGHYEMIDEDGVILEGTAVELLDTKALALLNASEIDQQIATARRYPRSLANFTKEVRDLVTLDPPTAQSCIYAVPRAGKTIEGASVRFAEMVNYSWGNTRVGTRIVDIGDLFVTVEGMFFDLEKNTATKSEVLRRITNRKGEKFDADMIQVTAAAAGAIARRNAILVGIPKALWAPMYDAARLVVAGDIKTLVNRVHEASKAFAVFGILPAQIFGVLGVKGFEEITTDHLVTLAGIHTAIKEKTITPESAFAEDKWPKAPAGTVPPRPERTDFKEPKAAKNEEKKPDAAEEPKPVEQKVEKPTEQPKDTASPAQQQYLDWLKDQYSALAKVGNVRELDELEGAVKTNMGADEDEKLKWRVACGKRFTELTAAKGKKK